METLTPIPPETPIAVTLTAAEWNQVFGILNEAGPYRIVAPLITKIGNQTQAAAAQPVLKPNGSLHEAA